MMNSFLWGDLSPPRSQITVGVVDEIQGYGIAVDEESPAACAFLGEPYQSAIIGEVINIGCISERTCGSDLNGFAGLKGSPVVDSLLVR
jgi:hypothetical protein